MGVLLVRYILFSLLFVGTLVGGEADRSIRAFEEKVPQKRKIDTYDFSGDYPELSTVEIDARRKKNVEVLLNGEYPVLEEVVYEGSYGKLVGDLTGYFPRLSSVSIACGSAKMEIDLRGVFEKSCEIYIRGLKEEVVLSLPEGVGLVVHTHNTPGIPVVNRSDLKKKGWFGFTKKTFQNPLAKEAPVVLTIYIETTNGAITLQ